MSPVAVAAVETAIQENLETVAEVLVLEDLLVEEISIDGMCGVY